METRTAPAVPKTCVVVSTWTGQPAKRLHHLLDQMTRIDAGSRFDLVVVCNGGDERPLSLPSRFDALRPRVLDRENSGYNLGAWDHGWRNSGGHETYLFLQDECFLKGPGWVREFELRMSGDAGIGLLGEVIMWEEMSWPYIRAATDRDLGRRAWPEVEPNHPLDTYQTLLARGGIDKGVVGTHLPSLILFTSRNVLEDVGGFPILGRSYREAVASEIAISRLIASHGYRVARLKDTSFALIGHRQWTVAYRRHMQLRARAKQFLAQLGIRKRHPVG